MNWHHAADTMASRMRTAKYRSHFSHLLNAPRASLASAPLFASNLHAVTSPHQQGALINRYHEIRALSHPGFAVYPGGPALQAALQRLSTGLAPKAPQIKAVPSLLATMLEVQWWEDAEITTDWIGGSQVSHYEHRGWVLFIQGDPYMVLVSARMYQFTNVLSHMLTTVHPTSLPAPLRINPAWVSSLLVRRVYRRAKTSTTAILGSAGEIYFVPPGGGGREPAAKASVKDTAGRSLYVICDAQGFGWQIRVQKMLAPEHLVQVLQPIRLDAF